MMYMRCVWVPSENWVSWKIYRQGAVLKSERCCHLTIFSVSSGLLLLWSIFNINICCFLGIIWKRLHEMPGMYLKFNLFSNTKQILSAIFYTIVYCMFSYNSFSVDLSSSVKLVTKKNNSINYCCFY